MNYKKIIMLLTLSVMPMAIVAAGGGKKGKGRHHMHCKKGGWCEKWKHKGGGKGKGAAGAGAQARGGCKGGSCPRRGGPQGGRPGRGGRGHGGGWQKRKKAAGDLRTFLKRLAAADYDGAQRIINAMDTDERSMEPTAEMQTVLEHARAGNPDVKREEDELEEDADAMDEEAEG